MNNWKGAKEDLFRLLDKLKTDPGEYRRDALLTYLTEVVIAIGNEIYKEQRGE
jgi:hypothetical protein